MNVKTKLIVEKYIGEIDEGIVRRFKTLYSVFSKIGGKFKQNWQRNLISKTRSLADSMFGTDDPRYGEIVEYANEVSMDYTGLSDKQAKKELEKAVKMIDKKFKELQKRK